jgi:Na+/H+ antiporter NhaD/arsenite permease-like protein
MKHIDYLYFNIYNYFYRLSQYRPTQPFRTQAMYLFSLGSGGWLLLLESIYLHFIKHTRFASPMQSMLFAGSIYALTAALFHYIFIVRDRDQKIFGKYEEIAERNPRQKWHFFLSVGVLALPYVVLIAFAIFFPRPR